MLLQGNLEDAPTLVLHSFSATLFGMHPEVYQGGSLLPIPQGQTWKYPDPPSLGTLAVALCLLGFWVLPLLITWAPSYHHFQLLCCLVGKGGGTVAFPSAWIIIQHLAWHTSDLL